MLKLLSYSALPRVLPRASLCVLLCLLSCGPVYKTFYDYTPPDNVHERRCLTNCQQIRYQCEATERSLAEACQTRSQKAYDNCADRKVYVYNQIKQRTECVSNCFCSRSNCDAPNLELCIHRYNECYRTCGGEVVSHIRCVSNCEEVQGE